jgi:hypothetical protein
MGLDKTLINLGSLPVCSGGQEHSLCTGQAVRRSIGHFEILTGIELAPFLLLSTAHLFVTSLLTLLLYGVPGSQTARPGRHLGCNTHT